MYWKNVGYLCKEISGLDELHRPSISYTESKVFCNIKSITQSEFYQAQTVGLKPELKVEVKKYNDEDHFRYNGKLYKILRTYVKNDITELVLTSMVVENEQ